MKIFMFILLSLVWVSFCQADDNLLTNLKTQTKTSQTSTSSNNNSQNILTETNIPIPAYSLPINPFNFMPPTEQLPPNAGMTPGEIYAQQSRNAQIFNDLANLNQNSSLNQYNNNLANDFNQIQKQLNDQFDQTKPIDPVVTDNSFLYKPSDDTNNPFDQDQPKPIRKYQGDKLLSDRD